jgi:3-deoxy-D-manno-octulosonic-acid transferase
VSGNLKFDVRTAAASPLEETLRRAIGGDALVVVCGSTADGEEQLLLQAFREILGRHPSTVMVLAPRHPERFDKVANLIATQRIPWVRRSGWAAVEPAASLSGSVFLLDSVGELSSLYALASVAVVGGSLLPGVGGHNILEPAQHGVAILVGPHTANFREIVSIFERGEGIKIVSPDNLAPELLSLLDDGQRRRALGQRARQLFLENTGATARTLQALHILLRERTAPHR